MVTLDQTYDQDIILTGYIYDQGDPNTNTPFTITITAGNISAETGTQFYQTSPTSDASASINTINPWFVTKDGGTYRTKNDCESYAGDFADAAAIYLDSINAAQAYLDQILADEQQNSFFAYVFVQSAQTTAGQFYIDSNNVNTYLSKYWASHSKLVDLIHTVYPNVTEVTSSQIQNIFRKLNTFIVAGRLAPIEIGMGPIGPCQITYDLCLGTAKDEYAVGIVACTTGALGLIVAPWFSLGAGIICLITNSARYSRAQNRCDAAYNYCITH